MDAKQTAALGCALLTLCLAGCLTTRPTGRSKLDATPSNDDPQAEPTIVRQAQPDADAQSGSDSVEQRVNDFIARIDGVGAMRQPQSPPANVFDRPPGQFAESSRTGTSAGKAAQPGPHDPAAVTAPSKPNKAETDARIAAQPTPGANTPVPNADPKKPAQPPRLSEVSVRGAESPVLVSDVTNDGIAASGINGEARAATGPGSLTDLMNTMLSEAGADGSFRKQLDARLLMVIAGDYEQARRPLDSVTQAQQETADRLIEALITLREGHMGDPEAAARNALQAVDGLADTLRENSDLEIPRLVLCREVRGFGQYTPIDPPRFIAGRVNELVIYAEVSNFVSQPLDDGMYETRFSMQTTILTHGGDTALQIKDSDIVDRCANRRRDCYIPRLIRLPATLSPGEYVAKVTLVDKLGEKVTENRATFRILTGS
jgi:hypothetical protein